ncbi:MAG: DegT/DnrJ/EryC1/StrS family aminotransferase, partial [Salegentibacter sp.]
ERVKARREMHQFYVNLFADIQGVSVQQEPNEDFHSNHWLTVIVLDEEETGGIDREELRKCLEKENIESRPLWKPMHMQPVFERALFYGNGVAEKYFKSGLCLPSGSNLTAEDKIRIEKAVKDCFNR